MSTEPQTAVVRADPLAPLAQLATAIASLALLTLVLVQAWQVVARYVLNDSPGWTEPVAVLMLSTAMSFGAAAGVHSRSHFGFFLLLQAAPPALRRWLACLSHAIVLLIGAVLAAWSARLLLDGIGIPMAGAPLPQSANFAPLCGGGTLMVAFAIQALWHELGPRARAGVD
jgi:TRAP-type C4-dicarboxylate transport system permease small subunit